MSAPFDPIQAVEPVVVLVILGEMITARLRKRAPYEARDTATSLLMGIGNMVTEAAFVIVPVTIVASLGGLKLIPNLDFTVVTVMLCFVVNDLLAYWGHRMGHRMRWAWADHVAHHSSQHFNYSTGLRLGWTYYFTPTILVRLPLPLIGFPLEMILFVHGLNLAYQFLMHTEQIRRLPGWFENVMNTPSHHRAHHGSNARYLDCNFGCVFIVWDRIFGTFVEELDEDPPHYGLVSNIGTFNLVRVATHEWVAIGRDVARARTVGNIVLYLLGPPGWSPTGDGETTARIREKWLIRQATDPNRALSGETAGQSFDTDTVTAGRAIPVRGRSAVLSGVGCSDIGTKRFRSAIYLHLSNSTPAGMADRPEASQRPIPRALPHPIKSGSA